MDAKVLVVGATNRLDMLDPALLRKGRFDKVIHVGLPTEAGRLAILRVHARNKGWASESEKEKLLREVASLTVDHSGAELQNILNEASILSARKDKDIIEREELLEALKRQEGFFKTGEEDVEDVSGETRMRVAYREAAIAVLECYFPNPRRPFSKTTIRSLDIVPNMEYIDSPSAIRLCKKSDIIDSIIRTCAPRVVEDQIFGKDNVSWISGASLEEAGILIDYLILQTGMTALGKIHYQTKRDVVVNIGPKIQALRDEYLRYAMEKCAGVLKEYRSALETIAAVLLEKLDLEADEIWDIFNKAPRMPQPEPAPIDEYGSLIYCGRWGIYGVTLPGRVTFNPGSSGFATFGAPRPQQLKVFHDDTWKLMDSLYKKRVEDRRKKKGESFKQEMPDLISQQIL